jgi:hypothetical protein
MWNIESIDDIRPHLHTEPLEAKGPKPFLWLSRQQFLRIRDFVVDRDQSSVVIVDQGSGYVEVLLLDAESEIVDRTNIPAN